MESISVIIPTWNREKTIEKAVRSALNQTLPPLEVLVCDDGSTDTTRDIIESINDKRVIWVAGAHGGRPAIPRNRGIKVSKGEWIAFLDSDDEWLEDKLELQFSALQKNNLLASSSNALRFIPSVGIKGSLLNYPKSFIGFEDLIVNNSVICSSTVFHRSLLSKIGAFPEQKGIIEDYAYWLRVCTLTDFVYINKPALIYSDDAQNSVRGIVTQDVFVQRKDVFQDFLKWANEQKINNHYVQKVRRLYYEALYAYYKRRIKNIFKYQG